MADCPDTPLRVAAPTLGESVEAHHRAGCWLSDVNYPAAARFRRHAHEDPYICLVTGGAFEETIGARRYQASAGAVVLMPGGWEHADLISDRGARGFVIAFPASVGLPALRAGRVVIGGAPVRAMMNLWRAARRKRLCDDMLVEQLAMIEADDERSSRRAMQDVARRAKRLMELRCMDHGDMSVGALAAALGVHRSYLSRAFQAAFGMTLVAHRRRLRVHLALRALSDGMPPAEAAALAHFTDQSHLTRAMLQELGVTPGEYRRLSLPRTA